MYPNSPGGKMQIYIPETCQSNNSIRGEIYLKNGPRWEGKKKTVARLPFAVRISKQNLIAGSKNSKTLSVNKLIERAARSIFP